MSHTENVMAFQPGMIFGNMDNGDMLTDRNSGEFLPADQVIYDPDHIWKFDFLDEDKFGHLKGSLQDDFPDDDEDDFDTDDEDSLHHTHVAEEDIHESVLSKQNVFGGNAQNSRTVSVRKQSTSRNKRGKIRNLD